MLVTMFRAKTKPGRDSDYLDYRARLLPKLEKIDGFVAIQTYRNVHDANEILGVTLWRDEQAIERWCEQVDHRKAQALGRAELFEGYHITVANVVRDYDMFDRGPATDGS